MEVTKKPTWEATNQPTWGGMDDNGTMALTQVGQETVTYELPDVTSYDLMVTNESKPNNFVEICWMGLRRNGQVWNLTISLPACAITLLNENRDYRGTGRQCLIGFNYFLPESATNFEKFLNHIGALSERVKDTFQLLKKDVSKWSSPIKTERSIVLGVRAKIRNVNLIRLLEDRRLFSAGVISVSMSYFSKDRSGIVLELLDVQPL